MRAQGETSLKVATFRSGGLEKVGLAHAADTRLFDLAKEIEQLRTKESWGRETGRSSDTLAASRKVASSSSFWSWT